MLICNDISLIGNVLYLGLKLEINGAYCKDEIISRIVFQHMFIVTNMDLTFPNEEIKQLDSLTIFQQWFNISRILIHRPTFAFDLCREGLPEEEERG